MVLRRRLDTLIIRYEEVVLSKIGVFILQLIDSLLKYNVVYTQHNIEHERVKKIKAVKNVEEVGH